MGMDSEKTKENSDDHMFQGEHGNTFEQWKKAASSVSNSDLL